MIQHNSKVETLDVEENGLGGEGAVYIADMLRENSFITAVVSISLYWFNLIYSPKLSAHSKI